MWRPAAAAGFCVREWDATQRLRAEAPRGQTQHSATGPRDLPGDKRQKRDSGTSVGEEAAAATPGPGGDSRSEVHHKYKRSKFQKRKKIAAKMNLRNTVYFVPYTKRY